jgi:hypothetical protein
MATTRDLGEHGKLLAAFLIDANEKELTIAFGRAADTKRPTILHGSAS